MKWILLLLSIGVVLFVVFRARENASQIKPAETRESTSGTPADPSTPPPPPPSGQANVQPNSSAPLFPTATATPQAQPTPKRSTGYFLRSYKVVRDNSGAHGKSPGTRVAVVSKKGAGRMEVTDGKHIFEVTLSDLTDDPVLAQALTAEQQMTNSNAAPQTSAAPAPPLSTPPPLPPPPSTPRTQESQPYATPQPQEPPAAAGGDSTPYDNPLKRKAFNATKDKKYVDAYGRVYWVDIYGRRHYD